MSIKNLAVIPARGGSKGIPRKNLRPLAGKPLLFYSINACLSVPSVDRVIVSTDDDEIALFAERFGASVVRRPDSLADDVSTLDPVIKHAVEQAEAEYDESYGLILTVQPTSPLIQAEDLEQAIAGFDHENSDTLISVVDDRHLSWTIQNGRSIPLYDARVNRQQLPPCYKETGAIVICTRAQLDRETRIGENIQLYEIESQKAVDIDTFEDFQLCDHLLNRKHFIFHVVGSEKVGTGHVYRALMLAHEFIDSRITFICSDKDGLAIELIRAQNYPVVVCNESVTARDIFALSPDLVVNDILDTDSEFILSLKEFGISVVNFEDMGSGCDSADLVINALYPHQIPSDHVLVGADYFCLRDEFIHLPFEKKEFGEPKNILLTFGGVDEGNITLKVLEAIYPCVEEIGAHVDVVTGPGFMHADSIMRFLARTNCQSVSFVGNTRCISDFMLKADMAFTSGGRTVFELTALNTPSVVICQNDREMTHSFASSENGIINLGHREHVNALQIVDTLQRLVNDEGLRRIMFQKIQGIDLVSGKQRVVSLIKNLLL